MKFQMKLLLSPRKKRAVLAFVGLCFAGVVLAKFWGPFPVSLVHPVVQSFADDEGMSFLGSGSTPGILMNVKVSQIKRGDIVRFVYASGEVYDMEAMLTCSYLSSVSCLWSNITKKSSITDKPTISSVQRKEAAGFARDMCRQESRTFQIPTYRWVTSWPDYGDPDVLGTTSTRMFAGYDSLTIQGVGGCR